MCEIVYGVFSRLYRKKRETKSAEEMTSKYNGKLCRFFNFLLYPDHI